MIRFYFKKLVADKVVENCLVDPKVLHVEYRELSRIEHIVALIEKIKEEADEIPVDEIDDASKTRQELADLQIVVDELKVQLGITSQQIEKAIIEKLDYRGGVHKAHYVDYVDIEDDSEWVEILRQQPDKYREVNPANLEQPQPTNLSPGVYRHYKNQQLYEVLGTALQTETEELVVICRPLYRSDYQFFARPYQIFVEDVEYNGRVVKRFERVSK